MPQHPTTPGADPRLAPLYRKITWRLLPFLLLCYVFAYLDRINIASPSCRCSRTSASPTRSTAWARASSSWATCCSRCPATSC